MKNTYSFAGVNVEISSQYESVHLLCRNYRVVEPPDFSVCIEAEDIAREKERCEHQVLWDEARPRRWRDPYLEQILVYRRIADELPFYNRMVMHGSAVCVEGDAYLFSARSGVGKSTHTRLWREMLGEKAVMINDDKPILKIDEEEVVVYGTPYAGKHRLSSPLSAPLRAVSFLERSAENHIRPVSAEEAFLQLFKQTHRPEKPEALGKTLELMGLLSRKVSCYRLYCNMDPSAARMSYGVLSGCEKWENTDNLRKR